MPSFFRFPPELRNLIYEYISLDSGACILSSNDGRPSSPAPLSLTSRTVYEEYQSVLYNSAPCLTAHVRDFDFAHVIQFLDNLSEREARNNARNDLLGSGNLLMRRHLTIVLSLTDKCRQHLDQLHAWLKLITLRTSDHYRTSFQSSYTLHPTIGRAGSASTVAPITLMRIIDDVYCSWYLQTPAGPLKEEIGKACDCLGEAELRINRLRTGVTLASGPRMGGLEIF
ncbi:hypothetical protein BDY17DRAFT_295643 [Neohortaea acidophila]|uniref:Uncharacterized protein n=1 Tax=Neohortaea acidophila TaxID=245834 RepID=A0A6A6PZ31_9PEZI|nr:uncharacterized protein BDY17DRAFT_295643 [Neohortaea acidophila]KAF2484447.1 hypothetical protein BDY17DRAFT_295643 [Neohortaea acidophila]